MNKVVLRGVGSGNQQDDRTLLVVDVYYNDEIFSWELRVPPSYVGSFDDYLQLRSSQIIADVEKKLQEWEILEPKTRVIESPFSVQESQTVDILREEIVKPTYPDYYVLRSREYPSLAEQLDSMWKGGTSLEEMQQKISSIKEKYPKE